MEESSLQFFLGLAALAWGIFTGWRNSKQPENINEEQSEQTTWKKIKAKTTTEEDYHQRMEKRIEDLMDKLDAGEIDMADLTPEDRQVIIDIRMQNESGDNLK